MERLLFGDDISSEDSFSSSSSIDPELVKLLLFNCYITAFVYALFALLAFVGCCVSVHDRVKKHSNNLHAKLISDCLSAVHFNCLSLLPSKHSSSIVFFFAFE